MQVVIRVWRGLVVDVLTTQETQVYVLDEDVEGASEGIVEIRLGGTTPETFEAQVDTWESSERAAEVEEIVGQLGLH